MKPRSLALLAAAGLALGAFGTVLVLLSDHQDNKAAFLALALTVGLSFLVSGVIALWRRPDNHTGFLLVTVSYFWFLGALTESNNDWVFTLGLLVSSFALGAFVHVLLAYPTGYFLAMCVRRRKYVLLLLIIAPFLTSYLLRVLAWKVILGDAGVINSFLTTTGLTDEPVSWLLYSQFTVMLVLAYVWVPFVALPIFVSLDNLDRSLLEAASDLGASRWQTFLRVTLRVSAPGLFAAFLFVFIPTIGEFVTPLLVGGPSGYMYGNAIQDAFTRGLDWETGSMLAIFMLGVIAILMAVFGRYLRVRDVAG